MRTSVKSRTRARIMLQLGWDMLKGWEDEVNSEIEGKIFIKAFKMPDCAMTFGTANKRIIQLL